MYRLYGDELDVTLSSFDSLYSLNNIIFPIKKGAIIQTKQKS